MIVQAVMHDVGGVDNVGGVDDEADDEDVNEDDRQRINPVAGDGDEANRPRINPVVMVGTAPPAGAQPVDRQALVQNFDGTFTPRADIGRVLDLERAAMRRVRGFRGAGGFHNAFFDEYPNLICPNRVWRKPTHKDASFLDKVLSSGENFVDTVSTLEMPAEDERAMLKSQLVSATTTVSLAVEAETAAHAAAAAAVFVVVDVEVDAAEAVAIDVDAAWEEAAEAAEAASKETEGARVEKTKVEERVERRLQQLAEDEKAGVTAAPPVLLDMRLALEQIGFETAVVEVAQQHACTAGGIKPAALSDLKNKLSLLATDIIDSVKTAKHVPEATHKMFMDELRQLVRHVEEQSVAEDESEDMQSDQRGTTAASAAAISASPASAAAAGGEEGGEAGGEGPRSVWDPTLCDILEVRVLDGFADSQLDARVSKTSYRDLHQARQPPRVRSQNSADGCCPPTPPAGG